MIDIMLTNKYMRYNIYYNSLKYILSCYIVAYKHHL